MADQFEFESTWTWVRNTTGCPKCRAQPRERCIAKSGRRTNFMHQDRKDAHVAANHPR